MTFTNQTNRVSAVGSGSIGQIVSFSFPVNESSDLLVLQRITATGVESTLVETTNYTVAITGDTGGTVTTVTSVAVTAEIHVIRDTPQTQELDLENGGDWGAENAEDAWDKTTKLTIENTDALTRTLRFPKTDPSAALVDLDNSVDRAGKYLFFDSTDGFPTVASAVDLSAVTVTPYAETLLDDTDATTARKTLGLIYDNRAYADLAAAIADIGATEGELHIYDAETLTASATFPKTLSVIIHKGGSIAAASTYVLTFNGPFSAGPFECITGFAAGDITFENGMIKDILVDWFQDNDDPGTRDMLLAIQTAIDSVALVSSVSGGVTMQFLPEVYAISDEINIVALSKVTFKGHDAGGPSEIITAASNNPEIKFIGGVDDAKSVVFVQSIGNLQGCATEGITFNANDSAGFAFNQDTSLGAGAPRNTWSHTNTGFIKARVINYLSGDIGSSATQDTAWTIWNGCSFLGAPINVYLSSSVGQRQIFTNCVFDDDANDKATFQHLRIRTPGDVKIQSCNFRAMSPPEAVIDPTTGVDITLTPEVIKCIYVEGTAGSVMVNNTWSEESRFWYAEKSTLVYQVNVISGTTVFSNTTADGEARDLESTSSYVIENYSNLTIIGCNFGSDGGTASDPKNTRFFFNDSDRLVVSNTAFGARPTWRFGATNDNNITVDGVNWREYQSTKATLINQIYDIVTPANVKGLWLFDVLSGTSITDRATIGGASAHTVTLSANANTMFHELGALNRSLDFTGSAYWDAADSADFTFGLAAFSVVALANPDVGDVQFAAKLDETNLSELREWEFGLSQGGDAQKPTFVIYDETDNKHIGRYYNTDVLGTLVWRSYIGTYDGGVASAGINIYLDGAAVDDTNQAGQANITTMRDTATLVGSYQTSTAGAREKIFDGKVSLIMIVAEELNAVQVNRLDYILRSYAGIDI